MSRFFDRLRARALVLAGTLLLLLPATALAHLGLRRAVPSNGAHLAQAPRLLKLTFTEAVEATVARLRLIGPSETEIPISPLRQPTDSAQIILADVRGPLEGGVYRLEWQVVGRDGHPVRGTITYVVAPGATGLEDPDRIPSAGTAVGGSASDVMPDSMHHDPTSMPSGEYFGAESPGYVAIRAAQFTALLIVIGALAFSFVVLGRLRRMEADHQLVASMRARSAQIGFWAAVALLVTAFVRLYAQSLAMHGPGEALEPSYVLAMVAATVWGWGWLVEILAALIAIAGFRMARHTRAVGWIVAAIAGAALTLVPALSGHAAATPGLATLAVIADALHVMGAAGWLGSLLFVLIAGIPIAMTLGPEQRGASVANLVHAFSPTALIFAGLAALTGVFAAWLHVGFSSALWTSDYGRTLLIKLAILSVVLATGAYNWLKVKPALDSEIGVRRIQRSASVELAVGVLVVIVTAVLVATPPPMDMDGGATTSAEGPPAPD